MSREDRRLAYVALWLAWSLAVAWGAYQWVHYGEYTAEQRVRVEELGACRQLIPDAARECMEER